MEALIHFVWQGEEAADPEVLRALADRLKEGKYREEPLNSLAASISFAEQEPHATATSDLLGYRLTSPDGSWLIQVLRDGLSVHHVGSYPGWDALEERALDALSVARAERPGLKVVGVACRFINHIVASSLEDPASLLRSIPFIPGNQVTSPLAVLGFTQNLQLEEPRSQATASVTQYLHEVRDDAVTILLDIETRRNLDVAGSSDDAISRALRDNRLLKNRIFFSSITGALRRRYTEEPLTPLT